VDAYTAINNLQKTVPPLFFEGDFKFHDPEVLEYLTKNGLQQSHLQQEKVLGDFILFLDWIYFLTFILVG